MLGCNAVENAEPASVIGGIVADGVAVVLVERDMLLVMNLSDRIHVLTDGHTLAGDAVAEVRASEAVVEATPPAWRLSWSIRSWRCRTGSGATASPSYRWTRMPARRWAAALCHRGRTHHRGRLRRRAHDRRLVRAGYLGL